MFKKLVVALALVLIAGGRVGAADSDLQQIADALDVSTTKTFQFTANGSMYALGQSTSPAAPWPRSFVKSFTRVYDFTAGTMRDDIVRMVAEGTRVKPGDDLQFGKIIATAVPASNIVEGREGNHPKANNWVGYVFDLGGNRYFHAGDTDHVPELESISSQAVEASGLAASIVAPPLKLVKCPRVVATIACFAANPTVLWTVSISQVPVSSAGNVLMIRTSRGTSGGRLTRPC